MLMDLWSVANRRFKLAWVMAFLLAEIPVLIWNGFLTTLLINCVALAVAALIIGVGLFWANRKPILQWFHKLPARVSKWSIAQWEAFVADYGQVREASAKVTSANGVLRDARRSRSAANADFRRSSSLARQEVLWQLRDVASGGSVVPAVEDAAVRQAKRTAAARTRYDGALAQLIGARQMRRKLRKGQTV
jgi:hypothetical protein